MTSAYYFRFPALMALLVQIIALVIILGATGHLCFSQTRTVDNIRMYNYPMDPRQHPDDHQEKSHWFTSRWFVLLDNQFFWLSTLSEAK